MPIRLKPCSFKAPAFSAGCLAPAEYSPGWQLVFLWLQATFRNKLHRHSLEMRLPRRGEKLCTILLTAMVH